MAAVPDAAPYSPLHMLVICPSRARVQNIATLLDCWEQTGTVADLFICLDEADRELERYKATIGERAMYVADRWRSLCDWVNHIAGAWVTGGYSIIGQIGDDHHPRTPGWDAAIAAAMQPHGVVYGNDLHQGERLPTAVFVDAGIVRRLGYMVPPEIQHLYMDNWFKALGERLGTLAYLPDVVIEHMHPDAGKAPIDDGYRQVNSPKAYRSGKAAYQGYMNRRLEADLVKLT